MKYTKQERLDIGRRIYDGELSRFLAAETYNISEQTARTYMRMYRDINNLPAKAFKRTGSTATLLKAAAGMTDLESMTKEELILEVVKARIAEARLKKGYEVKGDGSVIRYDSRNTR